MENSRHVLNKKFNRARPSELWAFGSQEEYWCEIHRLEAIRDDLRCADGPFQELSTTEREYLFNGFTIVWQFFFSWPSLVVNQHARMNDLAFPRGEVQP